MNSPALKIVPSPETLESLCTEIAHLKHEESVAVAISVEHSDDRHL